MHDPPDKSLLLVAIARFLTEEVRPAITDPRLNFRVLIAAHLAMVVNSENQAEEAQAVAELARLGALYPEVDVTAATTGEDRRALLRRLSDRLAAEIRGSTLDDARARTIKDHVRATLAATLSVNSPRFDTSAEIE